MSSGKMESTIHIVHEQPFEKLVAHNSAFAELAKISPPHDDMHFWRREGGHSYDFHVLCIGKTGYGKSTILNKIIGLKKFDTDDVTSCTKELYCADFKLPTENCYLSLCDLPGIGESAEADRKYLKWYREMVAKSDCIVYVFRADCRDYAADQAVFSEILKGVEDKVIIAINCADKIEPIPDPVPNPPFPLDAKRKRNLRSKTKSVAEHFGIAENRVIPCSAKYEFNIDLISGLIAATILTKRNRRSKYITPWF